MVLDTLWFMWIKGYNFFKMTNGYCVHLSVVIMEHNREVIFLNLKNQGMVCAANFVCELRVVSHCIGWCSPLHRLMYKDAWWNGFLNRNRIRWTYVKAVFTEPKMQRKKTRRPCL